MRTPDLQMTTLLAAADMQNDVAIACQRCEALPRVTCGWRNAAMLALYRPVKRQTGPNMPRWPVGYGLKVVFFKLIDIRGL